MAGLVPAIHVFTLGLFREDVDARDKRGHDGGEVIRLPNTGKNGLVRDAATTRSFPRKRESSTVQ